MCMTSPTVVYQTLVMLFYIKNGTECVGAYFHVRDILYGLCIYYILEYCVYIHLIFLIDIMYLKNVCNWNVSSVFCI